MTTLLSSCDLGVGATATLLLPRWSSCGRGVGATATLALLWQRGGCWCWSSSDREAVHAVLIHVWAWRDVAGWCGVCGMACVGFEPQWVCVATVTPYLPGWKPHLANLNPQPLLTQP